MSNGFYNAVGEYEYNIEHFTTNFSGPYNFIQKTDTDTDIKIIVRNKSYDFYDKVDLETCKTYCDNNSECIAFSRNKNVKSNQNAECWLKKNINLCDNSVELNNQMYNTYINDRFNARFLQSPIFYYKFDNKNVPIIGPNLMTITKRLGIINKCSLLRKISYNITTTDQGLGGISGCSVQLAIQRGNTDIWASDKLICTIDTNPRITNYKKNISIPNDVPIILHANDQFILRLIGIYPGHFPKVQYLEFTLS
jgi:hypothetical protein